MKKVNLSDIIGDNCANSFALAFRSMFCTELIPTKGQVKKLILTYLKEYEKELSVYFDESVLGDYCFVTDTLLRKRKIIDDKIKNIGICGGKDLEDEIEQIIEEKKTIEYTRLFNSGLYNLGMILSLIDESIETDWYILYYNSVGNYSEGEILLTKKMEILPTIHLGISSYIIDHAQMEQKFSWNKHYNVAPNMQYIIKTQKTFQCCKGFLVQNNPEILSTGGCFLSDILLLIDLYRVKQQCILEKFMLALLFIAISPEYEEWMQEYAYITVNILNEIMYCGEIHRLYLQDGYYNTMSDSEKTSKDATTRMSIIFSASNDDIYIIRLDLPHKGEKIFHINMEEVVGDTIHPTGYPMTYEEFNKLKLDCDKRVFNNLFFVLSDQIWFRTKFETILKHEDITTELKEEFKKLFHRQTHISITTKAKDADRCENQIAFVDEVKKYLKRLCIPESFYLSFGKEEIAYSKEIKKVRDLFLIEKDVIELISDSSDCRVEVKEVFSMFDKYMDIEAEMGKKYEVSSIIEIWEILEDFMLGRNK